jgi:hypothetical protein
LHEVFTYVFRTPEAALKDFDEYREFWEVTPVEGVPGLHCDLFEGEMTCLALAGHTYFEIGSYPDEGASPKDEEVRAAGHALAKSLMSHANSLAKSATKKVSPVPPKALIALLGVVEPPPILNGLRFDRVTEITQDTRVNDVEGAKEVAWSAGSDWRVLLAVFNEAGQAQNYETQLHANASLIKITDLNATCFRVIRDGFWVCTSVVENAVIISEHRNPGSALDKDASTVVNEMARHVRALREGNLPAEPRAGGPAATSVPPAPTRAPPTPTLAPGPSAINAGNWSFNVHVQSNNCPGGNPAPGTSIPLTYNFGEVPSDGGDRLLIAGDAFHVQQTVPAARNVGIFQLFLPLTLIYVPVANGGVASLGIVFEAANRAQVHYIEDYGTCRVVADTRR